MPDKTAAVPHVRIQAQDIDIKAEIDALCSNRLDVGAVVTFSGLCRDENGRLSALELEHYPGMAEAEILRIAENACSRWPLTGLRAIHRFGKISPGENIVLVVAASSHRQSAFDGASYLMDFLKTRAPFWKKEHMKDGSSSEWVSAKDEDDKAAERWKIS